MNKTFEERTRRAYDKLLRECGVRVKNHLTILDKTFIKRDYRRSNDITIRNIVIEWLLELNLIQIISVFHHFETSKWLEIIYRGDKNVLKEIYLLAQNTPGISSTQINSFFIELKTLNNWLKKNPNIILEDLN